MSTAALENLLHYIQGMNLSLRNRQWLAERLVEPEITGRLTKSTSGVHELAHKICSDAEYQQLLAEGFLDNPRPQYQSFTETEMEWRIHEAEEKGYISPERSALFMESLLKV